MRTEAAEQKCLYPYLLSSIVDHKVYQQIKTDKRVYKYARIIPFKYLITSHTFRVPTKYRTKRNGKHQ